MVGNVSLHDKNNSSMLIPEKAPGNIKWKTEEESNSLCYAEDRKGGLHHLSWDTSVSSEKWKGNCPYRTEIHVLLRWTSGGTAVWADRRGKLPTAQDLLLWRWSSHALFGKTWAEWSWMSCCRFCCSIVSDKALSFERSWNLL